MKHTCFVSKAHYLGQCCPFPFRKGKDEEVEEDQEEEVEYYW